MQRLPARLSGRRGSRRKFLMSQQIPDTMQQHRSPRSKPFFFAPTTFAALLSCSALLGAAQEKPNFIFVMADDLGYGDLGCYGQKLIQTPHIDRLAEEGLRFTNFYAGSTVCAPSRCVLMTGLHTGHCYIRGNGKYFLRPGDVTIAEMLHKAGYVCGQFGKWGLGGEKTAGMPTKQGFDVFYGYLDQTHAHNYYPSFLIDGTNRVSLRNVVPNEGKYGQGVAEKKRDYSHDLIFSKALDFIDKNRERAFFLYLPVTIPHANNQAGKAGMEVPDYGPYAEKDWPEPQKGTAAMISRLDRDMGKLLEKLREHGLDEKTLLFFTSDNGPHREGGNDPDFFDSNGPLRGIKRDLYDGGIRVPMIARWPGVIAPGTETDHIAYHGDLFATLTELAGVKPPANLDSISFAPLLRGEKDKQYRHLYLYWEFYERKFSRAARFGDWKAVQRAGKPIEIYHITQDPGEQNNIAKSSPKQLEFARRVFEDAHVPSNIWKVPNRNAKTK